MGRGIAKTVSDIIPELKPRLGNMLNKFGNHVHVLQHASDNQPALLSLPVKAAEGTAYVNGNCMMVAHAASKYPNKNSIVPGFHLKADKKFIMRSLRELVMLTDDMGWAKVAVPYPGCGAGELSWEDDVKPLCDGLLDDRFELWTFEKPKTIVANPYIVFVSGSMNRTNIDDTEFLDKIHQLQKMNDVQFVVGDCKGVDTKIQELFKLSGWTNLTILHMGDKPRNNLGFDSHSVPNPHNVEDKAYSALKDKFITEHAHEIIIF
jgi:hypothetical protein